MKVIVQDVETGNYLALDGKWVAARAQARDFVSLMRAYHFAREHTSRRFQVLLHSPDDQYSATMMAGVGTAAMSVEVTGAKASSPAPAKARVIHIRARSGGHHFWSYANRLKWRGSELN